MKPRAHVLLTGVTGFLGKVVLHELLQRGDDLGIERISVLIRSKEARGGTWQAPEQRFADGVAQAAIFTSFPPKWSEIVDVVGADLEAPNLGLSPRDEARLVENATHVIHCAASVEFDLPIARATATNVDAALNVLALARRCGRLRSMVAVSTAYVSPWRSGPIEEVLAPLPRATRLILGAVRDGSADEAELLAECGHPNTYTLTKCIAEHLLDEERGSVPLVIVRPSIISAAWSTPFPGWVDSAAAFAGCLLSTGIGVVKVLDGRPDVCLDVVPVDVVASSVVDAGFSAAAPLPGDPTRIRHCVMGLDNAVGAELAAKATVRFFTERPGAKTRPRCFLQGNRLGFAAMDFWQRILPTQLLRARFTVQSQMDKRRQVERASDRARRVNAAFRYFLHRSFDFRSEQPAAPQGFNPEAYVDVVNRGIYRHLLGRDESALMLAGRRHETFQGDLRWALAKPHGGPVIRAFGFALRKTLRRCTTAVTYDRSSFERALAAMSPAHTLVLAPSHRSYFDFLLCSYLCFQQAELGMSRLRIAAAEEFARIPVVGHLLTRAGAFYVRRGLGTAAPELQEELERALSENAAVMFFIEGQRSRSRYTLDPKRGLLRALQQTGRSCIVLPIAVSYERVPEEAAFDRELSGGRRSTMSVEAIVRWFGQLLQNQVQLGHVHISCGRPLEIEGRTSVPDLAARVAAELQARTVITSFHLRMFLAHAAVNGVDESWLRRAIERRGGRVLDSNTPLVVSPTPSLLQSLQSQWIHWFHADAACLFPNCSAVCDHLRRHDWSRRAVETDVGDPRVRIVVEALFRSVTRAYDLVSHQASGGTSTLAGMDPMSMLQQHPHLFLPDLEDALRSLADEVV